MAKPSVFIGSSNEGLEVARAIQFNLRDDAETTIWNEGFFSLSKAYLETLVSSLEQFDFAIFVLTADDATTSREVTVRSARDNVLFELGLFMGRLGRDRTFIVHNRKEGIKIPTDLAGITLAPYESREDNNLLAALSIACTPIRSAIRRLGKLTKQVELLDFYGEGGEAFYASLVDSYRNAKRSIYVSARGFTETNPDTKLGQHISELLAVTESALARGVTIMRIQTRKNASSFWADKFAALMEKYPDTLKVFADYSDPALVNVGIIDPTDADCLVELMFEAQKFTFDVEIYPAVTAIFIRKRRELAESLQRTFIKQTDSLKIMSPDDMRSLGASFLYFAYGSNLSTKQMKERCPNAKVIGAGVIFNWRLAFSVKAPHLGGVAAGIYKSENDTVSGVVYQMTYEDKVKLDRIESGGYIPVTVNVKMKDRACDAFTYIPVQKPVPPETSLKPPREYLNKMIVGAREHGLKDLVTFLEGIET